MEQLDKLQSKIRKQEINLWKFEDEYRAKKKKIEESYNNLEDNRQKLIYLYDEFREMFYYFIPKEQVFEEEQRNFINLLESYTTTTEIEFRKQYEKIEEEDKRLSMIYNKEHSQLEAELERSYLMRKKLYEEE